MLDFHTALRFQDLPDPLKIIFMHDESRPMVLKLYHSAAKFHEKSSNTYLFSNNLSIISFFFLLPSDQTDLASATDQATKHFSRTELMKKTSAVLSNSSGFTVCPY